MEYLFLEFFFLLLYYSPFTNQVGPTEIQRPLFQENPGQDGSREETRMFVCLMLNKHMFVYVYMFKQSAAKDTLFYFNFIFPPSKSPIGFCFRLLVQQHFWLHHCCIVAACTDLLILVSSCTFVCTSIMPISSSTITPAAGRRHDERRG